MKSNSDESSDSEKEASLGSGKFSIGEGARNSILLIGTKKSKRKISSSRKPVSPSNESIRRVSLPDEEKKGQLASNILKSDNSFNSDSFDIVPGKSEDTSAGSTKRKNSLKKMKERHNNSVKIKIDDEKSWDSLVNKIGALASNANSPAKDDTSGKYSIRSSQSPKEKQINVLAASEPEIESNRSSPINEGEIEAEKSVKFVEGPNEANLTIDLSNAYHTKDSTSSIVSASNVSSSTTNEGSSSLRDKEWTGKGIPEPLLNFNLSDKMIEENDLLLNEALFLFNARHFDHDIEFKSSEELIQLEGACEDTLSDLERKLLYERTIRNAAENVHDLPTTSSLRKRSNDEILDSVSRSNEYIKIVMQQLNKLSTVRQQRLKIYASVSNRNVIKSPTELNNLKQIPQVEKGNFPIPPARRDSVTKLHDRIAELQHALEDSEANWKNIKAGLEEAFQDEIVYQKHTFQKSINELNQNNDRLSAENASYLESIEKMKFELQSINEQHESSLGEIQSLQSDVEFMKKRNNQLTDALKESVDCIREFRGSIPSLENDKKEAEENTKSVGAMIKVVQDRKVSENTNSNLLEFLNRRIDVLSKLNEKNKSDLQYFELVVAERNALQDELNVKTIEIQEKMDELKTLNATLEEKESTLTEKQDILKNILEDGEKDELRLQIAELKDSKDALEKNNLELQANYKELVSSLLSSNMQSDHKVIKERIVSMTKALPILDEIKSCDSAWSQKTYEEIPETIRSTMTELLNINEKKMEELLSVSEKYSVLFKEHQMQQSQIEEFEANIKKRTMKQVKEGKNIFTLTIEEMDLAELKLYELEHRLQDTEKQNQQVIELEREKLKEEYDKQLGEWKIKAENLTSNINELHKTLDKQKQENLKLKEEYETHQNMSIPKDLHEKRHQEIDDLQKSLKAMTDLKEFYNMEKESFEKDVFEARKEIALLKEKIEALTKESQDMSKELADLKVKGDVDKLKQEFDTLEKDKNELQEARAKAEAALEELKSNANSKTTELEDKIKELQQTIENSKAKTSELENSIFEHEAKAYVTESEISTKAKEIETLQAQLDESRQRLEEMKNQKVELEQKVQEMESEMTTMKYNIGALEQEKLDALREKERIEEEKRDFVTELESTKANVDEVKKLRESDLIKLKELDRLKRESEIRSSQEIDLRQELDIARTTMTELKQTLEIEKAATEDLKNELEMKTAKIDELNKRKEDLEEQVENQKDETEDLAKEIHVLEDIKRKLENKVNDKDAELDVFKNKTVNIRTEFEQLLNNVTSDSEGKNLELEHAKLEIEQLKMELHSKSQHLKEKDEEIKQKNEELERIQYELTEKSTENEKANEELGSRNVVIEKLYSQMEVKTQEISAKIDELHEKELEIAKLTETININKEQIESVTHLKNENDAMKESILEMKDVEVTLKDSNSKKDKYIQDLQEQVKELSKQLSDTKNSTLESTSAIELELAREEIEKLTKLKEKLEADLATAKEAGVDHVEDLEEEIEFYKSSKTKMEQSFKELMMENDSLTSKIATLEFDLIEKDNTITSLEGQLREVKRKPQEQESLSFMKVSEKNPDAVKEENEKLKKRISELQGQISERKKSGGKSEMDFHKLEERTKKLELDLKSNQKYSSELEKQLLVAKDQDKNKVFQKREEELKQLLNEQFEREDVLQRDLDDLRTEFDRLSTKIAEMDDDNYAMEEQLESMKSDITKLMSRIEELTSRSLKSWEPKVGDEPLEESLAEEIRSFIMDMQTHYLDVLRKKIDEISDIRQKLKAVKREKELDSYHFMSSSTQTHFITI